MSHSHYGDSNSEKCKMMFVYFYNKKYHIECYVIITKT